jgi:hypothetical protein
MERIYSALRAAGACIAFFSLSLAASAQTSKVGNWYKASVGTRTPVSAAIFEPVYAEQPNALVKNELAIDINEFSTVLANSPSVLDLNVPYGSTTVKLNLARVSTTATGFSVVTDKGEVSYSQGIHYRGIVNDDPTNIASISIFDNEVMGFFSTSEGNFTIGKLADGSGNYGLYNEKELPNLNNFNCGTLDATGGSTSGPSTLGVGCKVVSVYFECDYKLYLDKGSNTTNVANYVNGFFNQVSTLYANENIEIQISQLFIWTTPDPYAGMTTTNAVLTAFQTNKGTNFPGNLAHFLTTRNLGGGIAYINVLCNKSYAFGVSMIYNTYSVAPAYSWTVEVVTHELGHNIGSPHTQACSWPGGPIDNCYTPEGSCSTGPAPVNGGTIMSYCHLTGAGINFNNGFGYWPGMLIRDKVTNGACLSGSGTAPSGLSTTNVSNSSATLNWNVLGGALQYTVEYKLSTASAWVSAGTTTGTSINLSGLASSVNYVWHVKSDCSAFSPDEPFTTLYGTSCPSPIPVSSSNITQNSATVKWNSVTGATGYTVVYKVSTATTWTTMPATTDTTMNVVGLAPGTTYNWRVSANCSVVSSAASFTTVSSTTTCAVPANLGATNISATSMTIVWSPVAGATGYSIKFHKQGQNNWSNYNNISGTSKTITGLQPSATYEWKISTKCSGGLTSAFSSISSSSTMANMIAGGEAEQRIKLYPNPAKGVINLVTSGWNEHEKGEMKIFNIQGLLIKTVTVSGTFNTISLEDMADGMYMMIIKKEGEQTVTRKFLKSGS